MAEPIDIMGDGSIMKTVVKAAPAENTASPQDGHKVKVHYVGTLTADGSKFDSSRDRDSPFDFTVGSGVITGWSEAVPTMKVGEIAKFTICSDKAYGASGSPPKIPPNASLDFEIELLSFTDRDDVCRDGSLLKKKVKRSDADWKMPNDRCDVELKVKGSDGDWKAVSWPAAGPPPAGVPAKVREGVHGMKKGEVANFLVTAEDAEVELEVVSWVENEDCVRDAPGAVVKRVKRERPEGEDDWKTPQDEGKVTVRGSVWKRGDDSVRVDYGALDSEDASTWTVDEDREVPDGGAKVCGGVEAVVKKMKVGEVATAAIAATHGFADGPLAGCALDCELELVGLVEEPPTWELKGAAKIAACEAKKGLGNAHVAAGDFSRASRRYGAALNIAASDYDLDDAQKAELGKVSAALKLNRAMCHLKLEKWADADKDCREVLEKDPANLKALFRRGKAKLALDDWVEAKALFKKALAIDASNKDARRGLLDIAKKEKAHKEKEKKLYAGRKLFKDEKKKKSPNPPVAFEHQPGPDAVPADAPQPSLPPQQ